mgnify:CR=1 FL=1
MSAINFVVRDNAGNTSRGSVAGEGVPASLVVGSGADISLNLSRGQIISYTRQGQALEITLIDGRVITIEGYFSMEGGSENQLFLSSDGYLTEVDLSQGAGEDYYASYIADDGVGKFAMNDDLYFMRGADVMLADSYDVADDEVGMLAAALGGLAPALGLGGAAAAVGAAALVAGTGGGGGGGGGGGDPEVPTVTVATGTLDGNDHVVNEVDHADGVDVGGTGAPGATVDVTINGHTETTTVDVDGNWAVQFAPATIETGEYSTPIEVTISNEGGSATIVDTLVVDTIIGVDMAAQGGADGIINATEYAGGVTLTGTVTGGDSVVVTIAGVEYAATVSGSTWSLDVDTSVMGEGVYTTDVTITATDAAGNSASNTGTVVVDTEIGVDMAATGGADGVINATEYAGGVTLSGTVTGGDSVVVTIGGVDYAATVSGSNWTLDVASGVLGEGEYTSEVTVTATDAAGNSASSAASVVVDTLIGTGMDAAGGSDGVVNATEYGDGVTLTGTVTGSGVVVVTIDGQAFDATVTYNEITNLGTWTLDVPTSVMGGGEYTQDVVISTSDAAGNSSSTTATVVVDTLIGVDVSSVDGGDGVINASEFNGGVALSGTVTGNDSVVVTIDGQTFNAVVNYNEATNQGTWTLAVPTTVMGQGEYTSAVTVTTTDPAGNSASASMTVEVDTLIGVTGNATGGADGVINATEFGSGVMLSGSVTGNDSVVVTIDGQDYNAVVSYNEVTNQGTWTLAVPTTVMGAGEYSESVTITTTDAAGNTASASQTVVVDTLIGVSADATGGIDNVINDAEFGSGVTLTGTVTGNDAVVVTIDGRSYDAVVNYNEATNEGTWTLAVPASVMGEGEYTKTVSVTTTDAVGNSDTTSIDVKVDTFVNELETTPTVAGDDIVNAAEAAAGLTLSGTVEENSVVTIRYTYPGGEIIRDAVVDSAGNWSITYDADEVPAGEYDATVTIAATDAYGNTDSITDTFRVDTSAPEAPGIESVVVTPSGVTAMSIDAPEYEVEINEVTSSHQTRELADETDAIALSGTEDYFRFDNALPNGSHLVVNETDASGNSNATFVVLEETGTNAVDLVGLSGFDIGAIDLGFAQDAELTLDLATLEGLSDRDNNLIIHGSDVDNDSVTILGAADSGTSTVIDGKSYDLYTMGDDAQIFIEDGINVTI